MQTISARHLSEHVGAGRRGFLTSVLTFDGEEFEAVGDVTTMISTGFLDRR
jgi:hypothetical protein